MIFITKINFIVFLFFIFIGCGLYSCTEPGCMDANADNYNVNATEEDGSCIYLGCTDPQAVCNYDVNATEEDGSCDYESCVGCVLDEQACNYNPNATVIVDCNYNSCLQIDFKHFIDGIEIVYSNDNMIYENNAGNMYSVRRLLYVFSDITLLLEDGTELLLDELLFVNTDAPSTLTKTIYNLSALCSGISFRLGFTSINNIENNYIDLANNFHSLMLWPNLNGVNLAFQGGYHYMKLEGKYVSLLGEENFYNTHTGPTNGIDFSNFYSFEFNPTQLISINMNINKWYDNPIYDFNSFGSGIMDNIVAQENLYQNSSDVFYVETN